MDLTLSSLIFLVKMNSMRVFLVFSLFFLTTTNVFSQHGNESPEVQQESALDADQKSKIAARLKMVNLACSKKVYGNDHFNLSGKCVQASQTYVLQNMEISELSLALQLCTNARLSWEKATSIALDNAQANCHIQLLDYFASDSAYAKALKLCQPKNGGFIQKWAHNYLACFVKNLEASKVK